MKLKLIVKILVLIAIGVFAYFNRTLIAGIVFGGALSVVYFTLTGSTLNWKVPKKK